MIHPKRNSAAVFVLVLLFLGTFALVVNAQDDDMVIESSLYEKHTMPSVPFTHETHSSSYVDDCAECHHRFEGGKNVWTEDDDVQYCQECHTNAVTKDEKRLSPDKRTLNLKLAYHNNCRGCHLQQGGGPIKCSECHTGVK